MSEWYLMVLLVTTACQLEFTLASDPCDQECILERLADLELRQRTSDVENHELREIITQQQSTIESQGRRIDTLEKTVADLQQTAPVQEVAQQEEAQQQSQHAENESVDIDEAQATLAANDRNSRSWPRQNIGSNRNNGIASQTKRQERAGIAFSSYLSHDVEVSSQQTIKFDKIITNEGHGYNNHTGVFTCPEGGMYLLTYFIGERDERGQWVKMLINSVNMVDAAIDTAHPSQDLQGGNSVIVRLKAGDAVWLESSTNGGHVEGSTGSGRFSTFSGVFLYP